MELQDRLFGFCLPLSLKFQEFGLIFEITMNFTYFFKNYKKILKNNLTT